MELVPFFLLKCPACNRPGIRLFGRGLYSRQLNRRCLACERAIHSEIPRWHYEIANWVIALLSTLLAAALFFTVFAGELVSSGLLIVAFAALDTAWMCTLHVRSFRLRTASARPLNCGVMRNNELSSAWPWLIAGTLLLMASSAVVLFAYRDTGGQFPIPMYQAVLYFFMPYSLLVVLPLAFWGSFGFLWESKRFGLLVLAIATVIGLLDGVWFVANWDDGYRYQGSTLTLGVALANVVGLSAVATLSAIGLHKRSKAFIAAAYFMLFEVLVLFAFPFFGSHES